MASDLFRAIVTTTRDADLRISQDCPRSGLRLRFMGRRGMCLERYIDRDLLIMARDADGQLAWLIENTYNDLKRAEEKEPMK